MTPKFYQSQYVLSRDAFWGKPVENSLREKAAFLIAKFFYNLTWLPARILFKVFFSLEFKTKENLKKLKGPLIIASSHASLIDSFLIGAVFPFGAKVFPIRFACWYKYFYSSRYFLPTRIFGSFPVRKGLKLEKTLEVPMNILKNKGTVGIFPEGKRNRSPELLKGKRGTAYLALKTRTKILPLRIRGNVKMTLGGILLRRYKIKIKIGKKFYLPAQKIVKPEDLNEPTELIMKKIREL